MKRKEEKSAEEKIARLEEQIAEKKATLHRAKMRLKEKSRKAKNKRIFEVGTFVDSAGILDFSNEILLGAMLELANSFQDENKLKAFKTKGENYLKDQKNKKVSNG